MAYSSDDDRRSRDSRKLSKKKKRRRNYSDSSDSDQSRRRNQSNRSRSSSSEYKSSHHKKRTSSSKSSKKFKTSNKSSDSVFGLKTGTLKDVLDVVPGFSKMTPAEQSKIRVRRALKLADESKTDYTEQELWQRIEKRPEDIDIKSQIKRANQISMIAKSDDDGDDDDEFIPSHFKSTANSKASKKQQLANNFNEREVHHEKAIFSQSFVDSTETISMLSKDEVIEKKRKAENEALKHQVDFMQRDPLTLMSEKFKVSEKEKEGQWLLKIRKIRSDLVDEINGVSLIVN